MEINSIDHIIILWYQKSRILMYLICFEIDFFRYEKIDGAIFRMCLIQDGPNVFLLILNLIGNILFKL